MEIEMNVFLVFKNLKLQDWFSRERLILINSKNLKAVERHRD